MVALEMREDRMVLCFGTQQLVSTRFVPGATYHPFFKQPFEIFLHRKDIM